MNCFNCKWFSGCWSVDEMNNPVSKKDKCNGFEYDKGGNKYGN